MPLSSIPDAFADMSRWLAALPSPAYIASLETRNFLCINQRFADLLGYSIDELRRLDLTHIRPREDLPLLEGDILTLPPQGSAERRYLTKTGGLLFVRLRYRETIYNHPDGSSQKLRFVVVISCTPSQPSPPQISYATRRPSPAPQPDPRELLPS